MSPTPAPARSAHAHRRRALVTLTGGLLAVGLAVPTATATGAVQHDASATAAPHQVVKVADLDRASHAKVPWLLDNVVHTAAGKTVALPWSAKGARARSLALLGRTERGWMVKDFDGNTWTVWVATKGKRTPLFSSSVSEGDIYTFALSNNARRYITSYFDGDHTTTLTARTVVGDDEVGSRSFDGSPNVLDFSGPRAVVGDIFDSAQVWTIDSDTVGDLGRPALAADFANDVLVAFDPSPGESGPTTISAPAPPPWMASMLDAAVSPGGGRILSTDAGDYDVLEVRNTATGDVRVSLEIDYRSEYFPAVWEDNNSFVLVARGRKKDDAPRALVRCKLSGDCVRVSGWLTTRISLPAG